MALRSMIAGFGEVVEAEALEAQSPSARGEASPSLASNCLSVPVAAMGLLESSDQGSILCNLWLI